MKKIITMLLILLLMPLIIAQSEIREPEPENYTPPANGIGYFIRTTLPEFFIGIGKSFDKNERINWKLQQLERRKAEYEFILEQLNATQSDKFKERYENMLKIISKRQEKNLERLEKYSALLNNEKKAKVNQILGNKEEKLNELKSKFSEHPNVLEAINKALEKTNLIRQKLSKVNTTVIIINDDSTIIQHELE